MKFFFHRSTDRSSTNSAPQGVAFSISHQVISEARAEMRVTSAAHRSLIDLLLPFRPLLNQLKYRMQLLRTALASTYRVSCLLTLPLLLRNLFNFATIQIVQEYHIRFYQTFDRVAQKLSSALPQLFLSIPGY